MAEERVPLGALIGVQEVRRVLMCDSGGVSAQRARSTVTRHREVHWRRWRLLLLHLLVQARAVDGGEVLEALVGMHMLLHAGRHIGHTPRQLDIGAGRGLRAHYSFWGSTCTG